MKVSELIGKKVLDKNAIEIGKVSDMDVSPKEGKINSITVSTGEMWRGKKSFEIKASDMDQIGDYVILNLEEAEIEEMVEEGEEESSKKTRLTLGKTE